MRTIDLNADLGEGDLYDDELMQIVSSCNVACGGHAGDTGTMLDSIASAIKNKVAIGAHPSYPDREGFGRRSEFMTGDEMRDSLVSQINTLVSVAADLGVTISHVKPHGALYNDAVNNHKLANLIAGAIVAAAPNAMFVGLPDSEMQGAAEKHGLRFVAEGFVDRAYQSNGQLVPRSQPGAVHDNLKLVLPQAISLVDQVDTLCIHGDTPGAAEVALAVRSSLEQQGVQIRAIGR